MERLLKRHMLIARNKKAGCGTSEDDHQQYVACAFDLKRMSCTSV
jgi:hypothetical protein